MHYDRPSLEELIDAACHHLEANVIPVVKNDAKLYFQTLVTVNILKIAMRQATLEDKHSHMAWSGMNALTQDFHEIPHDSQERHAVLTERNHQLCGAIRRGDYDGAEERLALLAYVKHLTTAQLEVANPKFLQSIAQEEQQSAAD